MKQNYTLISQRKQVQQNCCVSQNQQMLKSCRYDTLKGMIGNDDKFGFVQLHNVYQINISFLQFSTETNYAVADNSHIDVGRSIVQLHTNFK